MNQMIERLKAESGITYGASEAVRHALQQRIQEVAGRYFFGIDITPDLVKATKMNMVMNNDGSGNILRQDSLLHPHQWDSEFRDELCKALGIRKDQLRGPKISATFTL